MAPLGKRKKNGGKKQSLATLIQQKKGLEYTVAALLLTGKLRTDSVQIYKDGSVFVSLVGKYKSLSDSNNGNVDKLVNFITQNSDVTINDLMEAVKQMTAPPKS
ncbi:hypothetical protein [Paenibacillus massiliensis]|uniref:hypothetical protein n=1 Tax=Paenibacillus massiliensis TaxID=225917 RepID=UPI00035D039C|nr:hypothetical protein [Paenibacillus massiliensis]